MKSFDYKVFDCEKNEYLPGIYQTKGLNRLFGCSFAPSEYARTGILFKRRYRIEFAGSEDILEKTWAEEWDEARMKLLGGKDDGKTDTSEK